MVRLWQAVAAAFAIDRADGVTAIEYALIAALVALAIVTGATVIGTQLAATFSSLAGKV